MGEGFWKSQITMESPGWKVPETSRSKNVVVGLLKIDKGGGELLMTRKAILILRGATGVRKR